MRSILAVLLVFEVLFLTGTLYMGLEVEDQVNTLAHVNAGIFTTVFTLFIHCLVMFYLIGSGKDIKKTIEDFADLQEVYVPITKEMKTMVFPVASTAILLILLSAFAGAFVHSEILIDLHTQNPETYPVRSVTGWWIHLAFIVPALAVNIYAFRQEARAVSLNVKTIHELNEKVASRIPNSEY